MIELEELEKLSEAAKALGKLENLLKQASFINDKGLRITFAEFAKVHVEILRAALAPAADVAGDVGGRRSEIRTAIQDLKREARFLAVVDARDKALYLLSEVLVYLMPHELNISDAPTEIRERHAEQDLFLQRTNSHPPDANAWKAAHTDRAILLRALDAVTEENGRMREALEELAHGAFHSSMSREIARTALKEKPQ